MRWRKSSTHESVRSGQSTLPVVGAAAGAVPAPEGYSRAVRAVCDQHNVLLIVVACGALNDLHAVASDDIRQKRWRRGFTFGQKHGCNVEFVDSGQRESVASGYPSC